MSDDYRFEVAISFGTEPYRNPTYLPDVLNPWRYRAERRLRNRVENTADDQWDDWNLPADDTIPDEFTPYAARIGQTDDGTFVYDQICIVDITAPNENAARTRIENGLSMVVDEYTIRPFALERLPFQSAQHKGFYDLCRRRTPRRAPCVRRRPGRPPTSPEADSDP